MENLRRDKRYDRIVIPGWIDRMTMRELFDCSYAPRLELLLLPFERTWHEVSRRASRTWEHRLEVKTISTLRETFEETKSKASVAKFWQGQIQARLNVAPVENGSEYVEPDETPDSNRLDVRALAELRRNAGRVTEGTPTAKGQLVIFEENGAFAYLPPAGKVIVLSAREEGRRQTAHGSGAAERMLYKSVADLEPGMILAMPLSSDRDLIDAWADKFMANPAEIRRTAALWKNAIRRHIGTSGDFARFATSMAKLGQPRDPGTIRAWATQTHTVAPRNFLETIPLIARLTGDGELNERIASVEQSIDLIYRARASAAEAIVEQLFAGAIDLEADELTFDLDGKTIRYALHRVRLVESIYTVALDDIGTVHRIDLAAIASKANRPSVHT
jgi:hypothetical protein